MGRPRGSKNKVVALHNDDNNGDGGVPLRNSVNGSELLDYIRRIECCNDEQKEISTDRQQIFKELKQAGYDRDTVREIIRHRRLTPEQLTARAELMDQYRSALGDYATTPLGEAAIGRAAAE